MRRGPTPQRRWFSLLFAVLGTLALVACTGTAPPPPPAPAPEGAIVIDLKTTSQPYTFEPAEFALKAGQSYVFNILGDAEFHTFTVPKLDLDVYIDVNASLPLEFRVDTPGTFELICVPHEALGMVGTITVT